MLVLTTRVHEKVVMPESRTTVEVVAIQGGAVRLGIEAPADVRILRETIPDRVAEWGPSPEEAGETPTLLQINQLLEKRLDIARKGLNELRQRLHEGQPEDAEMVLDKIDEDLRLLRRRVGREVAQATGLEVACCGC